VSLASVTIHIPREYAQGSCEHGMILAHERLHAEQAQRSLASVGLELEEALSWAEDLPDRTHPITAPDFAAAADALRARVARVVDPIYARYEKQEAERQAELDWPDPYEAVYRACKDWK